MELQEISRWLHHLGYEDYLETFEVNGYDVWDVLFSLHVEDFVAAGIKSGHAIRIYRELQSMQDQRSISDDVPPVEFSRSHSTYSRRPSYNNERRRSNRHQSISQVMVSKMASLKKSVQEARRRTSIVHLRDAVQKVRVSHSEDAKTLERQHIQESNMKSLQNIAKSIEEMTNDRTQHEKSEPYFYGDLMIFVSAHFGASACSKEIVECVMGHKEVFVASWQRALIGDFEHQQKIDVINNLLKALLIKS